jgi:hypothetical protein
VTKDNKRDAVRRARTIDTNNYIGAPVEGDDAPWRHRRPLSAQIVPADCRTAVVTRVAGQIGMAGNVQTVGVDQSVALLKR